MGAIGIGSALSALPQGILQGEEIARRREREDEAARMAKAEFENRQTIFGRQKQEWGKSDAVDDATAAYLASAQTDADKETMYAKMAAAKAGGMALQTKGVLTQQRAAEQNIDLSAKSFDLQSQQHAEAMKKARRENLQQEIQMTLLGGDMAGFQASAQKALDETRPGTQIKKLSWATTKDGSILHSSSNGQAMMDYEVVSNDVPHKNRMTVSEIGSLLGSPHLMQLGQQQQSHDEWLKSYKRQGAMLNEERNKGNYAAAQAQLEKNRVDAAARWTEDVKNINLDLSNEAKKPMGADPARVKMLEEKRDIASQKMHAAYNGLDFYEIQDVGGKVIGIDARKTVIPLGEKDRTHAIDIRPADSGFYVNADNKMRIASVGVTRKPGESDDDYDKRVKPVAASLVTGWNNLVQNDKGETRFIPAPSNTYQGKIAAPFPGESQDNYEARLATYGSKLDENAKENFRYLAQGWKPIMLPNLDLGERYRSADVPAANAVVDMYADHSGLTRGVVSGGRGGGRGGSVSNQGSVIRFPNGLKR